MTICEQLHMDVLTAPIASTDRRALSQAWYSALYASHAPARRVVSNIASPTQAPRNASTTAGTTPRERTVTSVAARANATRQQVAALPAERRAAHSPLARRIERTMLRSTQPSRSATFSIGKRGRVHVVLQQAASGLRLVALCARDAHATVAQALAQARFALARRGIALETKLVEGELR